ncbi:hypothetical protein VP01_1656g3 [Puccinia sorghi]|uniref:Uncharacterized protein n=1 Tax=Puccinia sorghi TaxID=27349 RepID=A0A0L6VGG3_9BASI|nr:hypothetical protein VP01_1656g3 [Puccinia sorghi]
MCSNPVRGVKNKCCASGSSFFAFITITVLLVQTRTLEERFQEKLADAVRKEPPQPFKSHRAPCSKEIHYSAFFVNPIAKKTFPFIFFIPSYVVRESSLHFSFPAAVHDHQRASLSITCWLPLPPRYHPFPNCTPPRSSKNFQVFRPGKCYDPVTPSGTRQGFPKWGIISSLHTFVYPPVELERDDFYGNLYEAGGNIIIVYGLKTRIELFCFVQARLGSLHILRLFWYYPNILLVFFLATCFQATGKPLSNTLKEKQVRNSNKEKRKENLKPTLRSSETGQDWIEGLVLAILSRIDGVFLFLFFDREKKKIGAKMSQAVKGQDFYILQVLGTSDIGLLIRSNCLGANLVLLGYLEVFYLLQQVTSATLCIFIYSPESEGNVYMLPFFLACYVYETWGIQWINYSLLPGIIIY